jgi:hypothetical protein
MLTTSSSQGLSTADLQQQQMADAAPTAQRDQNPDPDNMMEDMMTSNMAGLSMANGHLDEARPSSSSLLIGRRCNACLEHSYAL